MKKYKFLKSILLIFCLLFTEVSIANEVNKKIKYPPYTEVWGYDILDTIAPNSATSINFATLPSGDLVLRYRSNGPKYGNNSVSLIHFFEGKKKEYTIETNDSINYLQNLRGKYLGRLKQYIVLKDKKIIETTPFYGSRFNWPHNQMYKSYVRRGIDFKREHQDYKKSVLGIKPCFDDKGEVIPFKHEVYYLPHVFLKLEDDTFIACNPYYPLIIRFDKDFNTKFKPQRTVKLDENRELKSNFYILPHSKIEYFYDHIVPEYYGDLDEEEEKTFLNVLLLNYLYALEQNENLIEGTYYGEKKKH